MRDRQVAVSVGTVEIFGTGDVAVVAAIDEVRARQVIAVVRLEDERPLKANVAVIGRFQELGSSAKPLISSFMRAILPFW